MKQVLPTILFIALSVFLFNVVNISVFEKDDVKYYVNPSFKIVCIKPVNTLFDIRCEKY